MNLKTFSLPLACAIGLLAATPANAESLRCDGCTYFQAQNKALAAGFGDHLVMDFQGAQLYRFYVDVDPEAIQIFGRPPRLSANDIGVSAADAETFRTLSDVMANNGGSLKLDVELRPGDPLYPTGTFTGFGSRDITWNTAIRESVGRTVAALDYRGEAGRLVSAIQSVALSAIEAVAGETQLRVIVEFPDGSSAVFVIDKDHSTQAVFELGSARDSEGNVVPDQSHVEGAENHRNLLGASTFNNFQNFLNFMQRARQLGIPFTDGRGSSNEERPIVVECTWSDGKLECRARYIGR